MVIGVNDVPYSIFSQCKLQKPKRKKKTKHQHKYKDLICAFDIETSTINCGEHGDQSFMYIWQMQIDSLFTIIGRTWEELRQLLQGIKAELSEDEYLCIFVHNLSYEFQFLSGVFDFNTEDVFCLDHRKVAKADLWGCFEFRCSYIHSNSSLDRWTRELRVEHTKRAGDLDYSTVRYPWTPWESFSQEEQDYMTYDVLGLVECIKAEMLRDDDTLYSYPLTATGYCRREAKRAIFNCTGPGFRSALQCQQRGPDGFIPDLEIYHALRENFRGGDTHANRKYAGIKIKEIGPVHSVDRSSSYPDVLVNCKYPMGEWRKIKNEHVSVAELLFWLERGTPVLCRVYFSNIRLRDPDWGFPYLALAKCRGVPLQDKRGSRDPKDVALIDNGRILYSPAVCTTLNDIDLKIIMDTYEFDTMEVDDLWVSRYGKLPRDFVSLILQYYSDKTGLKGLAEHLGLDPTSREAIDIEQRYAASKAKINSLYGLCAQCPIKQNVLYKPNLEDLYYLDDKDEASLLAEHNRTGYLSYAWACWCTSWARYRLYEAQKIAGDHGIYCDTDSLKYWGDVDWTAYNKARVADSKRTGAYAKDPAGKIHYMGVMEQEDDYIECKFYGAKKYAYRTKDGVLHATIAGVSKAQCKKDTRIDTAQGLGATWLEKNGGIDAFQTGFVFDGQAHGGGTMAVYNDHPEVPDQEIDGHTLRITRNVVIAESSYTLGLTADYSALLVAGPAIWDTIGRMFALDLSIDNQ